MYKVLVLPFKQMPSAEDFLTQEEKRYCQTLKIEKRRQDYLAGRYALKKLLSDNFVKADYKSIEILKHEDGRPLLFINGVKSNLNVSISHSNAYACACAGRGCLVGVDIERVEERSEAWRNFSFAKEEITETSPEFLTALWAKKEAVLKLLGLGLSVDMHSIRFDNDRMYLEGKLKEKQNSLGAAVISTDLSYTNGFAVAVAYSKVV
ncbi:4'-Phosphopantetheinyl transferase [Elusimicrobium minutum Pei191]|uniref:4'-Phosphopantetheinyl transferase n=1 Tax=Elusimicrobium minutum (strain Pei191) TaxID=445932 RepID=B2KDQ6_ELUMP|nr:4'-phosphopantetheinyl transferase superfamily protein [Elusimicrobium minutum]ACC98652.1 4'-Phosphopantetheinyl transferase [Elusimicrobium minutum Pei191]